MTHGRHNGCAGIALACLLWCGIGFFGAGCARERPPNVLLVVIDTLRADALGSYGAGDAASPALDALASGAVRFERAYATAPWTKPSVASLFTGLYPSAHGASQIGKRLSERHDTLAEILHARGYATAGIVSHVILQSPNGFAQGYERYLESESLGPERLSTPWVTEEATQLLEALVRDERPFLLFVHYFDPHLSYVRHPRFGLADERAGRLGSRATLRRLQRIHHDLAPAELRQLRRLYAEEVRFTDAGVGRLLRRLRELGTFEDTLIVVTSDHGEEFKEHGWFAHARTLYDEVLRVPLILRLPGRDHPRVVEESVSIVSVAPTVLDVVGIDPEPYDFQGRSLLPRIRDPGADGSAPLIAENERVGPQRSVVEGRFKLIRDLSTGALELYDLARDPGEQRNLAESEPERRERLLRRLESAARESELRFVEAPDQELSIRELELLYALGYAER